MTPIGPRVVIFRVPGAESAANADRLAATAIKAGLDVLIAPYWPDDLEAAAAPQSPLLDRDIGSAPRLSAFAFRQKFGFDLDLADLSAHLFATQPLTADLILAESIWNQHLRGVAQTAVRFLDDYNADIVFVPHGAEIVSRLLAEMTVATRRRLMFWESAFFPGFHYIDPHAPHFFRGECGLDRLPSPVEPTPRAMAFVARWKADRASKYLQTAPPSSRLELQQWAGADRRPMLFLPGQIATDANAVVGLGHHDSLGAVYRAALRSVPEDWRVIYKPHPLAEHDVLQDYEGSPDRLFRTDADIHDVFAVCDAVLTYSSNVGLEALLAGLPVILLGRPVYAGRGLTHDLAKPEALGALLAQRAEPPSPNAVAAFVELLLAKGLTADGDPAGLLSRIAEAGSRPQTARLPWYGQTVQAVGQAAGGLTKALARSKTLAEALAALPEPQRRTLLEHVPAEALAPHLFGGPQAPRGQLAPRPQPDIAPGGDLVHTDLKLEQSVDPAAALAKTASLAAPGRTLCLTLPSWNTCPPDAIQRLDRDDIDALCARCDPPLEAQVHGLDGDRLISPDDAPAWVVLAGPKARFPLVVEGPVCFRPWIIPPEAFTYREEPEPTRKGFLVCIGPGDPAIFGPYLTMPPGRWRISWRIGPTSVWDRLTRLLRRPRIVMDVVEHRDSQITVVGRTTNASATLVLNPTSGSLLEFRTSGTSEMRISQVPFEGVELRGEGKLTE